MIPYKVREFFDIPYHLRKIKWIYQRISRGYSDRDLWSFDSYLSKVISEGLRQLAVQSCGCPSEFYDEKKKGDECIKWKKILLDIAEGFESKQKLTDDEFFNHEEIDKLYNNDLGFNNNKEWGDAITKMWISKEYLKAKKECEKKWDKAIALFKEYYGSFWD